MTKSETTYKKLSGRLINYLQEHSKRCTTERLQILQYCCEETPPITVSALEERARKDRICLATIYTTLDLLMEAGLLQRVTYNSRQNATYTLPPERRSKMKFICTRCGRRSDLKDRIISDRIRARSYDNFQMDYFTVYVYGRCKLCKKLIPKTSKK